MGTFIIRVIDSGMLSSLLTQKYFTDFSYSEAFVFELLDTIVVSR